METIITERNGRACSERVNNFIVKLLHLLFPFCAYSITRHQHVVLVLLYVKEEEEESETTLLTAYFSGDSHMIAL
jgi:hypothetical protein